FSPPSDYRTFAGTAKDYAQLLQAGYLVAKAANPNAKILMAGTTYWADKEGGRLQFFDRVLDALVDDPLARRNDFYFDAVDVHTYGNPLNSYLVPLTFRRIMRDYRIDKPVWITESNVLIRDDPRVVAGPGPFRATIDEQASYV